MSDLRNYTRWRRTELGDLNADLLGLDALIHARPHPGNVALNTTTPVLMLSPDEARLIGVRLIEAAALADGDRAIRETP